MILVRKPAPPSKWETFRNMDGTVPSVEECDQRFPVPVAAQYSHRGQKYPTGIELRKEGAIRRASADLDPTEAQVAAFMRKLTTIDDHLVFVAGTRFHVSCRVVDGTSTLVSAARFYWCLRYPLEPFGVEDRLINTCGYVSKDHAGNGLCVTHLRLEGPSQRKRA